MNAITSTRFTFAGECVFAPKNCTHLTTAVNSTQIRKNVSKKGGITCMSCQYCKPNSADGDNEESEVSESLIL